jgi:hypothetical protein
MEAVMKRMARTSGLVGAAAMVLMAAACSEPTPDGRLMPR